MKITTMSVDRSGGTKSLIPRRNMEKPVDARQSPGILFRASLRGLRESTNPDIMQNMTTMGVPSHTRRMIGSCTIDLIWPGS